LKIIFVRHGLTPANEQRLYCGSTNNFLSPAGVEQVKKAARALKKEKIDVWLCGESKRTKQTLKIIFDELVLPYDDIVVRKDIKEIDFGKFENFSFDEVSFKYPDEAKAYLENWQDFTFPGGDNVKEYFSECEKSVFDITDCYKDKNICIIGHKGYISACLCAIDERGLDSMFDIDIKCGEMIAVDFEEQR